MVKSSIAVVDEPHIAAQLGYPLVDINNKDYEFLLLNTEKGLCLCQSDNIKICLHVDFLAGKLNYRRHKGGAELLLKATGINKNRNLNILDATAGLGRDAFIMACRGAKVTMLERHPIIALLLEDALNRLKAVETIALHLIQADSISYMKDLNELPDVIYLDPMYPGKHKSALVKKEMQFLQALIVNTYDEDKLLFTALEKAKKRVVVKRPKAAAFLGENKPSFSLSSKNHRFDVYI